VASGGWKQVIEPWRAVGELPRGGLDVALELGRIASAPGTAEQRVEAMWEPLRRLVPFQAACIKLIDGVRDDPPRLISVGYDEAFIQYAVSPDNTSELELIGYNRARRPLRLQDMPVPKEQIRSWAEYLGPAGFREGLGVALFTPDGRFLGLLGMSTEDARHPTAAARDLIGMVSPLIANAVDPLRSMAEAALMVRDALAGVVLIRGDERCRWPVCRTIPCSSRERPSWWRPSGSQATWSTGRSCAHGPSRRVSKATCG
jgi:hypothetical protein